MSYIILLGEGVKEKWSIQKHCAPILHVPESLRGLPVTQRLLWLECRTLLIEEFMSGHFFLDQVDIFPLFWDENQPGYTWLAAEGWI